MNIDRYINIDKSLLYFHEKHPNHKEEYSLVCLIRDLRVDISDTLEYIGKNVVREKECEYEDEKISLKKDIQIIIGIVQEKKLRLKKLLGDYEKLTGKILY